MHVNYRTCLVLIMAILFINPGIIGFQSDLSSEKEMINFMVGGTWVSENPNNTGEPEGYRSFFMKFENWHDQNSILGSIYGIKNNSDTTGLMEVWNFVDPTMDGIRLIQRTAWSEFSEGAITLYKGEHLDIRFKSTTADGQVYYTRDIHYKESKDKLRAETFHRRSEDEEWQKAGESVWIRKR